ncbi:MAG: hypothetical protein KGY76_05195 [Candidatus Thermoplasmatota archaeon]|nr:hypothetical protein [Candidatus Thermoplasmatota archaeon]
MIGAEVIQSIPWYVKLGIAMLVLFWLARDITKQGMGNKYRWGWTILFIVGYFLWSIIGIAILTAAYLIWSRLLYSPA